MKSRLIKKLIGKPKSEYEWFALWLRVRWDHKLIAAYNASQKRCRKQMYWWRRLGLDKCVALPKVSKSQWRRRRIAVKNKQECILVELANTCSIRVPRR